MTKEDREELKDNLLNIKNLLTDLGIDNFSDRLNDAVVELDLEEWGRQNFDEFVYLFDAVELEEKLELILYSVRQVHLIKQDLGLV